MFSVGKKDSERERMDQYRLCSSHRHKTVIILMMMRKILVHPVGDGVAGVQLDGVQLSVSGSGSRGNNGSGSGNGSSIRETSNMRKTSISNMRKTSISNMRKTSSNQGSG